jgi:hypothetical protein
MTVPVQTPLTTIIAALNQAIFPFNFRCDDAAIIHVFSNDVERFDGIIALNVDQVAAPGGTVTLPAQPAGVAISIERQGPQQQNLAIGAYGAFQSAAVMLGLDKLVMLAQEVAAKVGRALTVSRANSSKMSTKDLPAPSPGAFLKWVDAGGGLSKLDNATLESIGAITVVEGEVVARTGAGTYQLAHAPSAVARVKLYLNGARLTKDVHYTVTAGGLITQLPGFISDPAEVMLADYVY